MKLTLDRYQSVYRLDCSGRELYANAGIVGITPTNPRGIFGGYDDCIESGRSEDEEDLTQDERVEIADFMIALWTQFKQPKS